MTRTGFRALFACGCIAVTAALAAPAAQALTIDTLEDTVNGGAVTPRVIEGVTVTITVQGQGGMVGGVYGGSPVFFAGAGNNLPLNPANVSGTRFISRQQGIVNGLETIIFSFDSLVSGFGFTTIDLLEAGESPSASITVRALDGLFNVVASQTRTGPQGPSGVDLDWFVSSVADDISFVVVDVSGIAGVGFGIDDLVLDSGAEVTVPAPGTLSFFAFGLAWMIRRRSLI